MKAKNINSRILNYCDLVQYMQSSASKCKY
jgi:hypothetical protein